MRVLCVAEKPSIARSITAILSGGQYDTRPTRNKFIKNFDFIYPQTRATFTVTAVSGHLTEHDFDDAHRIWSACDPFSLFDAPVVSRIAQASKTIEENLKAEARRADELMIWTDCDREGENIGAEVARICRKANARIRVTRARFSAIISQQIHNAAQHPVELDQAQADAVEARTILDLRLGAAFTRMQTLALQRRFGQIQEAGTPVSYGPCQFPTLGFVVSRYEQVQSFSPETFWYIYLSLSRPGLGAPETGKGSEEETTEFSWKRVHLFDFTASLAIYEHVLSNPLALVTGKNSKGTKKWKPLPLTTVELQKAGSRLLRLAPKKILDIAERLYQQGFLSYPRTETDQYDPQFDFMSLVQKQTVDPDWGAFAAQLQNGGFNAPRKGKKNDKAHPPIHPTNYAGNLVGDEKRVYEFVTRRFLASCSKDAEGQETTVEVRCGGEHFTASGLIVLVRNYLEVYTYDKWTGRYLPHFEEGEEFMPSVCEMREGQTSSPTLLTEADLVGLMDKNGIGTDATIAQHIQTIVDRGYVIERNEGAIKYLVPSTLGIGLIEGYNEIGFDKSLSKPQLRRDTERAMVEVCERTKSKNDMLVQSIEQYKEVFLKARREFDKVITSVSKYLEGEGRQEGAGAGTGNGPARGAGGAGGGGGGGGGGGAGGGRGTGRGGNGPHREVPDGDGGTCSRRGRPPARRKADSDDKIIDLDDTKLVLPPLAAPVPLPQARLPGSRSAASSALPSRTRSTPAGPSSSSSSVNVKCRCNLLAGERTVVKEGANKGRRFWKCGNADQCDFFEWMDGPSSGPAARSQTLSSASSALPHRTAPERSYTDFSIMRNSNGGNKTGAPTRRCKCDMTAVLKTVVRDGPNQGRKFWVCPNSERARCGYFEWDEDTGPSADMSSNLNTGSYTSAGGGGQIGDCFKCGEPGHWASSCPNGAQTGQKRTISTGSDAAANSSATACFKCGEEGHYSSSCPNGARMNSRTNSRDAPSYGSCFKCGEEGHFSNACLNGGSGYGGATSSTNTRSRSTSKHGRGRTGSRSSGKRGTAKGKSRFAAADD